jgi:hypothetical protein
MPSNHRLDSKIDARLFIDARRSAFSGEETMIQRAFFRFSVDETSIKQFFSRAEEHFKRYDQLLAQQDQKIDELSDQGQRLQKSAAKPAIGARLNS